MTPILLPVVSIGPLIPAATWHRRELRVHSCFEHALNLANETGELLTLLKSEMPDFPSAIRVGVPHDWDWRKAARAGEPVWSEHGLFRASNWSADISGAPRWTPESARAHRVESPEKLCATSAPLTDLLKQYCNEHGVCSAVQLFPGSGGRIARLYIEASRDHLEQELRALIGLGSGLTPDGDDFILGHVAALWPWQHIGSVAAHIEHIQSIGSLNLNRTTDISRHFLSLAFQGHYSQPVDSLTTALLKGVFPEVINNAALQVMRFGSSSGAMCMAGYLNGITSLQLISQPEHI